MKRNIILGSAVAALLAACGTGLIPAIPINNALNVEGQKTTIALGPSALATGNISVSGSFEDISDLQKAPAIPSKFSLVLAINAVDLGAGCPAAAQLPSSIDVTIPKVEASVSDSTGSTSASVSNVKFTVKKNGSSYVVNSISNDTITFTDVGKLVNILKAGGTNTGTLSASVNTVSTPDLAGCAMTVTWGNIKGLAQF